MCIRDRSSEVVASSESTPKEGAVAEPKEDASAEVVEHIMNCLLYTSDAADERSSVDLGGRRIIKKKKTQKIDGIINIKERKTA